MAQPSTGLDQITSASYSCHALKISHWPLTEWVNSSAIIAKAKQLKTGVLIVLDVHLDDFFKDCALILLTGIRHFPRPITLFVEDIAGPDTVDEFGLHSQRHLAALGTIRWLKDEGYIRFGEVDRQESVDEFIITSTTLTTLLKPVDDSETLARTPDSEPTPLYQILEFAHLDRNSIWLRSVFQQHILG